MKNNIKAEIVAHSKRANTGDEIITYKLTFPRIILSEVNTYKMLEKNTSSSRAIPFEKMVEVVEKEPFIPIAWAKPHKGMQGNDYYTDPVLVECKIKRWLEARDAAVLASKNLDIDIISTKKSVFRDIRDVIEGDNYEIVSSEFINPVTKQLKNRILEPFMWVTQLCTGTRESFEHLFEQRCPLYEVDYSTDNGLHFQNYHGKSKKEIIKYFKENNIACDFALLDGAFMNLKNSRVKWLEDELGDPERFKEDPLAYDKAISEKIYQLNVFVSEEEEAGFLAYMPNSKAARWTTHFTDVIPKDGGKNTGIDAVIAHFGIKLEETMAFGDGGNDIDMLKHAGIGVAMGNAGENVKEIADYITTSVDDDGITNALKHFNVI